MVFNVVRLQDRVCVMLSCSYEDRVKVYGEGHPTRTYERIQLDAKIDKLQYIEGREFGYQTSGDVPSHGAVLPSDLQATVSGIHTTADVRIVDQYPRESRVRTRERYNDLCTRFRMRSGTVCSNRYG